jgi:hypothetical protein
MKYFGYLLAALVIFTAHAAYAEDRALVLKYTDFGPPSMASQTIGMDWWQWDNHGDSDPKTKNDIKVVVFRGISLSQVRQTYPVVKSKEQDYRYLSYDTAITYLERNIQDNVRDGFLPKLTERLRKTKAIIIQKLGRPDQLRCCGLPPCSGAFLQAQTQGRAMAYDRADWHYGGEEYPKDLPAENGGTHIGLFLAWAINQGLAGGLHQLESQEALKAVRDRTMTGREFLANLCDEKFWDTDLNEEGNAFATYYYASNRYFVDYEATLAENLPTLYHVVDNWENYDKLAPVLDRRYSEWRHPRKKKWWHFWK